MFDKFRKRKRQQFHMDEYDIQIAKKRAEQFDNTSIQEHQKHYSEQKLLDKLKRFAKKAGSKVVYVVLLLFYTLQKKEIPLKTKATIAGALGYFILPIDLIPDVLLGVGYVDDLGVLSAALYQVVQYIDDDVKSLAKQKLRDWFGDDDIDTTEIDNKM